MGQGKYERTPLTQARFQLTISQRRIEKLLGKLAEEEHRKQEILNDIEQLEKAENE